MTDISNSAQKSTISLSPDQLVGKSGRMWLTLSAGAKPEISVSLTNQDENGQNCKLSDVGSVLKKLTLRLRPIGQGQAEAFKIQVTRRSEGDSTSWDVDFGNHPRAGEWNRQATTGYSVPLESCEVEEVTVVRETTASRSDRKNATGLFKR